MMKCRYKKDFSGLIGGFGAKAGLAFSFNLLKINGLLVFILGICPQNRHFTSLLGRRSQIL